MFFPAALVEYGFAPDFSRERNTNQAIARPITNASGIPMPSPTLAPALSDEGELGVAVGDDVGVVVMIVVAVLMVAEIELLVLEDVEVVELELDVCADCAAIPKVGELNRIPNASPSACVPFTIKNSNKVELS
jgi:hypothetical protein